MDAMELGRLGEELAAKMLKAKGYTILARNWRFERLEVDIIAHYLSFLIIVEVKARETEVFGHPGSFVDRAKQQHLAEAVEAYMEMNPENVREVRYDVVSVIINRYRQDLQHFEDAFWPDNLGLFSVEL